MRLFGIKEAQTRSEYVTTVLNQSVDAKVFEYPADLAVFTETQRKCCTRGKFQSVLLFQFDGLFCTCFTRKQGNSRQLSRLLSTHSLLNRVVRIPSHLGSQ
jgi:hypothetical protein